MSVRLVRRKVSAGPQEFTLPATNYRPRDYQQPLWRYMEQGGRHACVIWPRRHGKDLTIMNITSTKAFERVGLYWGVYPQLNQGRTIAWNGMDGSGTKFLDVFPEGAIASKDNSEMRITLKNGSIFQVKGTDYPDSLRGANPVGVFYSEYSMQDPQAAKIVSPILIENGGWEIYGYTPMGSNHGLDLYNKAKANSKWFCDLRTATELKVLTPEQLQEAREDLRDEQLFQQEYMCSFKAPLAGAYYAKEFEQLEVDKRITSCPVDPKYPVHTAWDLGTSDATAIWFAQVIGREVRLVNYYEKTNEGLLHFIKYLKDYQDQKGVMYGSHFAPWDIVQREWTAGKARIDIAREAGIRFTTVQKHGVDDGIEAVRTFLPLCYFDELQCNRGLTALKSYWREKDETRNVYKLVPVHDWASHGADAFRYLAWGLRLSGNIGQKLGDPRNPLISVPQKFACDFSPYDF